MASAAGLAARSCTRSSSAMQQHWSHGTGTAQPCSAPAHGIPAAPLVLPSPAPRSPSCLRACGGAVLEAARSWLPGTLQSHPAAGTRCRRAGQPPQQEPPHHCRSPAGVPWAAPPGSSCPDRPPHTPAGPVARAVAPLAVAVPNPGCQKGQGAPEPPTCRAVMDQGLFQPMAMGHKGNAASWGRVRPQRQSRAGQRPRCHTPRQVPQALQQSREDGEPHSTSCRSATSRSPAPASQESQPHGSAPGDAVLLSRHCRQGLDQGNLP